MFDVYEHMSRVIFGINLMISHNVDMNPICLSDDEQNIQLILSIDVIRTLVLDMILASRTERHDMMIDICIILKHMQEQLSSFKTTIDKLHWVTRIHCLYTGVLGLCEMDESFIHDYLNHLPIRLN
jgi:hypothetical protein